MASARTSPLRLKPAAPNRPKAVKNWSCPERSRKPGCRTEKESVRAERIASSVFRIEAGFWSGAPATQGVKLSCLVSMQIPSSMAHAIQVSANTPPPI